MNISFIGSGMVDGQGYWWWMREYVILNKGRRPRLVVLTRVRYGYFEGIKWQNSPSYHIVLQDVDSFLLNHFEIYVDAFQQKKLQQMFGLNDMRFGGQGLPTYALNTDGIDPSGSNIVIRNLTITSYDDAVAVKPAHQGGQIAKCAENILVENCTVYYGVGMTIGTVPPHTSHNCVRNVTFRNITFKEPFKAVYVKTNPGTNGDGLIENILYDGLTVERPLWWGIYIGPQQQKQPDGGGPGCMLYPLLNKCDTQPRVTIRNITLRNIVIKDGIFPPGVIRCNSTNPCTDFTFENVTVTGWFSN